MPFTEPDGYPFTESGGTPFVTKVPLVEWQNRGKALNEIIEFLTGGGGGGGHGGILPWRPGKWYSSLTSGYANNWDGTRDMDQYRLYTSPIIIPDDISIEAVGYAIETGDNTSDVKIGLYEAILSNGAQVRPLGARVFDFGTGSDVPGGDNEITAGGPWTLTAGRYFLAEMSNEAGSGLTMFTFHGSNNRPGQDGQAGDTIHSPYYDVGSFTLPADLTSTDPTGFDDVYARIAVKASIA